MPSYPQVTLSTLEAIYRLGKNICAEIEKFQPDIVIGLAHSGWTPVVVAQTLWAETRSAPFPPSMRTNIGQEKNDIYRARYGENHPAFCCLECCDRGGCLGHYLAWAAEQGALIYVALAIIGVTLDLSIYLMVVGCTTALACWDLTHFRHAMLHNPPLGADARLERYRLQALATAVFIGLSLTFISSYINLQFPFGAMVFFVLIAMGCLVYGVRYLVRNQ